MLVFITLLIFTKTVLISVLAKSRNTELDITMSFILIELPIVTVQTLNYLIKTL